MLTHTLGYGRIVVANQQLQDEEAIHIIAKSQGSTAFQIGGNGDAIGNNVYAFRYVNDNVVLLNGTAEHGLNTTQRNYLLDFIDYDCSQLSNVEFNAPSFLCYPSPTEGILHIAPSNCEVEVYNSFGQRLTSSKNGTVDLSYLPSAIYLVKQKTKNNSKLNAQMVFKK